MAIAVLAIAVLAIADSAITVSAIAVSAVAVLTIAVLAIAVLAIAVVIVFIKTYRMSYTSRNMYPQSVSTDYRIPNTSGKNSHSPYQILQNG